MARVRMRSSDGITEARSEARALHRRFGLTSTRQVDVHHYAARLNVQIVRAPLDGALAQLIVNGRSARIWLSHQLRDPARSRFAIAHELGHYVLLHPSPTMADLSGLEVPHPSEASRRDFEREADTFARELLMPDHQVDALCRARDPEIALCAELASGASVPIDQSAIRVTERSDHVCAVVASMSATIAWVAPAARFRSAFRTSLAGRLRKGMPLEPRSLACQARDESAPSPAAEVPACAWLDADGPPLLESAAPADDGAILTMLWAKHWNGTQHLAAAYAEPR